MSRIGNQPIQLPDNVEFNLDNRLATVKGPLGILTAELPREIKVELADGQITLKRSNNSPKHKALHGLTRALIANLIIGVTQGYEKNLELVGTGYRASKSGSNLVFSVGLSHPVEFTPPTGVEFNVEDNTKISVKGIDKQLVGQVAANIRKIRPPEPYKGKGIRYQGEVVRRKAGKAAKAAA